jgi:hypothetical protein
VKAGVIALETAAEAREVKASAAAAISHDQQTYDRGVRDGYLMRTEADARRVPNLPGVVLQRLQKRCSATFFISLKRVIIKENLFVGG